MENSQKKPTIQIPAKKKEPMTWASAKAWVRRSPRRALFRIREAGIYAGCIGLVLFRYLKARVGIVVYRIQALRKGYRFITAEDYFAMFPPNSHCKACNFGQGFFIRQRPDRLKEIMLCKCVQDQHRRSGKKLIVRGIE